MAGIFTTPTLRPQAPPNTPTIADASIQAAADAEAARSRKGRASTVLTHLQSQREASTSKQASLGGA